MFLPLQYLFSPIHVGCSLNSIRYTPPTSKLPKETSKVDIQDEICQLQIELVEEAQDNHAFLEHLFALFRAIYGKQKTLKAKIDHGFWLHNGTTRFKCNLHNSGWSLKCLGRFLRIVVLPFYGFIQTYSRLCRLFC